jgi:hypothetical protein
MTATKGHESPDIAFRLLREELRTAAARQIRRRRYRRTIGVGLLMVVLTGAGVALARNVGVPAAAFNDPTLPHTIDAADATNLAQAVARWNNEYPATGPGTPFTSQAIDLLTNMGREGDTVTAFTTRRGSVCFEIRAAGTCERLDDPSGITLAIFATRVGGTRVYGVAADSVARVQVNVAGVLRDAVLHNNAYYYQLPSSFGIAEGDAVQNLVVTSKDGTTHLVNVHG